MEQKNKLDKLAYGMLTVSSIISLLCFVAVVVASIYLLCLGAGDVNGGGWMIFIVGAVFVGLFPLVGGWVAQFVLYILGLKKLRRGNLKGARIFGLLNCIVAMAGHAILLFMGYVTLTGQEGRIALAIGIFAVAGVCLLYMLTVLVMLIVSIGKSKKAVN